MGYGDDLQAEKDKAILKVKYDVYQRSFPNITSSSTDAELETIAKDLVVNSKKQGLGGILSYESALFSVKDVRDTKQKYEKLMTESRKTPLRSLVERTLFEGDTRQFNKLDAYVYDETEKSGYPYNYFSSSYKFATPKEFHDFLVKQYPGKKFQVELADEDPLFPESV